jgi:hypothetical protein
MVRATINGGAPLQKICVLRAVVIEHLPSVIVFDSRCRCAGPLCAYSRDSHSQCPLLSVLDRALMRMNLVVFERQNLTIGIVDDKRVNIQSLKMCRLSCVIPAAADRRIEVQIQRGKKPKKSNSIAFCAE